MSIEEFPCDLTAKLNQSLVKNYMPVARGSQTWATKHRWLSKFWHFAKKVCASSGKCFSEVSCLRSNIMCRHFVAAVAAENAGVTRPRSARMVLSAERKKRGWSSLSEDADISIIVSGAEAAAPHSKKQSAGLTRTMVRLIVEALGNAAAWWDRQVALMVVLGFVTIMRSGEMCALKRASVRLVYKDGSEIQAQKLKILPKANALSGVLLHLPWRKNHKHLDCWIPLACPSTISLLLNHITYLRRKRCKSVFLFPSKRGISMGRKYNHIKQHLFVKAMQQALRRCIPMMTKPWSELYTGHALRVGGSNHMRRLGMENDVHRRLGGWMTLTAAQGYMALTAKEQFQYTIKMAESAVRKSAFMRADAVRALQQLRSMRMGL